MNTRVYLTKRSKVGRNAHFVGLKLERWRVWLIFSMLMALFLLLIGRALYLQIINNDFFQEQGQARFARQLTLTANRGMITDRNGIPLAISTPVQSIWASPKDVPELTAAQIAMLADNLGIRQAYLIQKLSDKQKDFVYLRRQLTPNQAKAVMALNLPGIFTETEYRRYYPAGEVTAHIIGFNNIDGQGQEGIELTQQNMLAGKPGSRTVIKDRRGYIVEDISSIVPPQNGKTLHLSVEQRIQYLAYRELKKMVESAQAQAGSIVVLDAKTGEILALANLPTYNPNSRSVSNLSAKRNRVVTDANEPGSSMKAFVAAAALESGKWRPSSKIDTGTGRMSINGATITDTSAHGVITVEEMVKYSSNIAAAKIGESLPREFMWNFYHELGFGQAPQLAFPGEAKGRLRPWKSWRPIEQMTMSYGYGLSASLIQLAKAYQIFATPGEIRPISLYKCVAPPVAKQLISKKTALAVRKMLEMAMEPGGTGKNLRIPGYRVAAKTGTARKSDRGKYTRNYIGSMIGFAPVSDPRLIVAVMIDESKKGSYFGALTAGPVFKAVMEGALRILNVAPDAPLNDLETK